MLYDVLRDAEIYRFIDLPPPSSVAALEKHYDRLSKQRSPDGSETWLNWAIVRNHDGQHMGTYQVTLRTGQCILGYVLASAFWGQGYALEAGDDVVYSWQAKELDPNQPTNSRHHAIPANS